MTGVARFRIKAVLDLIEKLGFDSTLVSTHLQPQVWHSLPAHERYHRWGAAMVAITREFDAWNFPIRLAQVLPAAGSLPSLELAMKTAPTLGDAFTRCERYHQIWLPGWDMTRLNDEKEKVARFELPRIGANYLGAQYAQEHCVSLILQMARRVTGVQVHPRRVDFMHAAPLSTNEHEDLFEAPIRFAAPRDAIEFDLDMMDLPLPGADPDVSEVVLEYLDYLVARDAPETTPLEERVRRTLRDRLDSGVPNREEIAKAMGMSESTLRRRLHDRGLSYTDILTEVRCDLARQLLVTTRQSLTEIAYSAGFSASSAFTRSFMHWHGETPSNYRKRFTPRP